MASTPPPSSDASTALNVGARLRALRRLYGLSQRELARRAGLANSAVSLIEQNRSSPTIATLRKLLAGFPISLAEFFGSDLGTQPELFYPRDQLPEIRGDALVMRQVGPRTASRRLQVLHEIYQPGGDTGESMLVHDGEEAGVVVKGRIEITVGGQQRTLGPGDAYYFDSRIPHRFRNTSRSACEVVSACTPPSF